MRAKMLIISKNGKNFNDELISSGMIAIRETPHRDMLLRIPHSPNLSKNEALITFTNTQFGGKEKETYKEIFEEILKYSGPLKVFDVPMGYATVRVSYANKTIKTDIRTNLNGQVRYLNQYCLLPIPSAPKRDTYIENEKNDGGKIVMKTSSAIFLSKFSVLGVNGEDKKGRNNGMSYSNEKLLELLSAMSSTSTTTELNLDCYKEDDKQLEVVYVIKLPDLKFELDTRKPSKIQDAEPEEKTQFQKLAGFFFAVKKYFSILNNQQIIIKNKLKEENGTSQPIEFGYMFLTQDNTKEGGKVSLPNEISDDKLVFSLEVFKDRLFGLVTKEPRDEDIFRVMVSFLDTYGFYLNPQDFGFSEKAHSSPNTAPKQSKASTFFAKKDINPEATSAPAADNGERHSDPNEYGRGRGRGRGGNRGRARNH